MCDHFVRRVNQGLLERLWPPMGSTVAPNRRGLVNEVAFQLFATEIRSQLGQASPQPSLIEIVQSVSQRLARFDRSKSNLSDELSEDEREDILEQLGRLRRVFPHVIGLPVIVEPQFPGCGFLDTCRGDILRRTTLYEIKAGDRPFRSVDLRQLITYTALNHVAQSYRINAVALVNIRSGLMLDISLEELTKQISGLHPSELFELLAYSLASGDMSR